MKKLIIALLFVLLSMGLFAQIIDYYPEIFENPIIYDSIEINKEIGILTYLFYLVVNILVPAWFSPTERIEYWTGSIKLYEALEFEVPREWDDDFEPHIAAKLSLRAPARTLCKEFLLFSHAKAQRKGVALIMPLHSNGSHFFMHHFFNDLGKAFVVSLRFRQEIIDRQIGQTQKA